MAWYGETGSFFGVPRSRSWVQLRRFTHSSHHRGQLTSYLRMLHRDLYSTYGPTADTGGLFQDQEPVIYRYPSVEDLLEAEHDGGAWPPLPGAPIVSRREAHDLFTLPGVLGEVGYQTLFVYGGRALFDGMGPYLSANGMQRFIVEQADFPEGEFSTAWGVSDQAILDRALTEMDEALV